MKYIYCHKFETKFIADSQLQTRKIGKSQSSFAWGSMKGDCNVYALFAVNAPIKKERW